MPYSINILKIKCMFVKQNRYMLYVLTNDIYTKVGWSFDIEKNGDALIARRLQSGNPLEIKGIGHYYCSFNFYEKLIEFLSIYEKKYDWYELDFVLDYENIKNIVKKHKDIFDFDTEILPQDIYFENILKEITELSSTGVFISTYTVVVEVGISKFEYEYIYSNFKEKIQELNLKNTGYKYWKDYKVEVIDKGSN